MWLSWRGVELHLRAAQRLGARTVRSRNPAAEFLMPVNPALYADLAAELAGKRNTVEPRKVWAGGLVGAAGAPEPGSAAATAGREA